MQSNALRKELTALITVRSMMRQPAIRRSSREEWLYATDVILLLSREERDLLQRELTADGWEYTEEHGWMLLRKTAEEPPENWYNGSFGSEAGSCASLLDRHKDKTGQHAETVQRILIKAGEEGDRAYESACRALHREWAERLRRGEQLPAVSRKYFGR